MKRFINILIVWLTLCGQLLADGTYSAGDIIDLKFTTRQASGAPTTLAGSPVIKIYKSNSTTTETTTGVTVTPDFDSVTGLNNLRVDTTTDGTFYANGLDYNAVITTGTVNSISVVGESVAHFRLTSGTGFTGIAQTSSLPTNLSILNIGRDGAVSTTNRGFMSRLSYQMPWQLTPANTLYVRTTGSDSNAGSNPTTDAFLTIQKAIDVINTGGYAFANTKIDVGNGSYSEIIRVPSNTWLSGSGRALCTITSSSTTAATVSASDNVILSGFKAVNTSTSTIGIPLGCQGSQTPSRNVVVIDVDTLADSDGSYFGSSAGNDGYWRFYNCVFNYKWDGATIIGENSTQVVDFYNCTWTQTGASAIGSATDTRAITGTGGLQRLFNPTITATAHVSGKLAYPIYARGAGCIEVYGGTLTGPASQPTDGYDIAQTDRGVIMVNGTAYTGSTTGNVIDGDPGQDWSKLRKITAIKALTGTTISTGQGVASVSGNVGGSVGSVTGSVGSVVDKTGFRLSTAGVDDIWDEPKAGHVTANTYGVYLDSSVSGVSTGGVSSAEIADAVWNELRSDHVVDGSFGQGVASVQGNVTGSVASVTGAVGSVTVVTDKTGYSLSSFGVDAIWEEEKAGHVTAGTYGFYLDSTVSSAGGGGLTAGGIADAVWDEVLSGHSTAGTAGKGLADAQTAGDPWATVLPGSYTSGQAGKIVGDILTSFTDVIETVQVSIDGDDLNAVADAVAVQVNGIELADPNGEPVPTDRTWVLKDTGAGLVGDKRLSGFIGSGVVYSIDFRSVVAANDWVTSAATPTISSGTAGGVTLGTPGRSGSQAKVRMTGVTAGTYVIEVVATMHSGNVQTGRVTLKILQ